MSEEQQQKQPPADANVGWEGLKSEKGQDYRVKASDYDITERPEGEDAVAAKGPKFRDYAVRWTVGSGGSTSAEVRQKTGINWYKLDKAPWYSTYTYRLSISCDDTYNYRFYDEEPDKYDLDVWQVGSTHFVEYRSTAPTIVGVSGF